MCSFCLYYFFFFFFFFQAEDGIRDDLVTGVQTCALPISKTADLSERKAVRGSLEFRKIGCFGVFAACGNVNAEGLPAPSYGNGSIRFQEAGDTLPKLTDTDLYGTQLGCSCS